MGAGLSGASASFSPRSPLSGRLSHAARTSTQRWPGQRAMSSVWDTFTTGGTSHAEPSPIAGDLGDLVLRAGRLAYHNPL